MRETYGDADCPNAIQKRMTLGNGIKDRPKILDVGIVNDALEAHHARGDVADEADDARRAAGSPHLGWCLSRPSRLGRVGTSVVKGSRESSADLEQTRSFVLCRG